jgi:hypothetical protein
VVERSIPLRGGGLARIVALLATVAIIAVGCDGGDGDDSSAATDSTQGGSAGGAAGPTKAEYLARADAICGDALAETARLGRRFLEHPRQGRPNDPLGSSTEGLFVPGLELREDQAERLMRLERPDEDSEALDAYLDLFGPIEELIRERIRVARAGKPEDARRIEVLMDELAEEQTRAARRAGLRECGKDFTAEAAFPSAGSR